MAGFIKLNRQMTEWGWYTDANTKSLWIHILLKANWKDGEFLGHKIPRGSFVTSIGHLSKETGLSKQSIRTSLSHLESTGEITKKSTNKFTVITVEKYEIYQADDSDANKQLTNNQQTTNKQLTTIEESKEYKEGEDIGF